MVDLARCRFILVTMATITTVCCVYVTYSHKVEVAVIKVLNLIYRRPKAKIFLAAG